MSEHDPRLDELDRRAGAAVAELDRAVGNGTVPDFAPASARRRAPLLLGAAVVALVALVGAGVVLLGDDGDQETTIAGEPDVGPAPAHLVLPNPEDRGFRIDAVFDGTEETAGAGYPAIDVNVHGDPEFGDPWDSTVVSYSLPADLTTIGGEAVDLDGTVGRWETDGFAPTLGWESGDEVHYLVSRSFDRDRMIELATAAIASGATSPVGLESLFSGDISAVFPAYASGRTASSPGVLYVAGEESGPGFVVRTTPGSEARLRASSVLAEARRPVTVRDEEATVADFGDDLRQVSWLEGDTLVMVGLYGMDFEDVRPLLEDLEEIGADEFAELAREHPIDVADAAERTEETAEASSGGGSTQDLLAEPSLASVVVSEAGREVEASVRRRDDESAVLFVEAEVRSGGMGSGTDLSGLDVNETIRLELDDGWTAVAGLIGPSADGSAKIRSAGEASTPYGGISGPSTATIDGTDHVLFLVLVGPGHSPDSLVVSSTAPDGAEVTLPV